MNRENAIFIYPRDMHGNRIGNTIAVIVRDGMMFFGEAVCSEFDQFCKKTGRELATQRAEERYTRYLSRQKEMLGEGN